MYFTPSTPYLSSEDDKVLGLSGEAVGYGKKVTKLRKLNHAYSDSQMPAHPM